MTAELRSFLRYNWLSIRKKRRVHCYTVTSHDGLIAYIYHHPHFGWHYSHNWLTPLMQEACRVGIWRS